MITLSSLTRSSLRYGSVSRSDHGAVFTCSASNNNISTAITATATLKLKCESNFYILDWNCVDGHHNFDGMKWLYQWNVFCGRVQLKWLAHLFHNPLTSRLTKSWFNIVCCLCKHCPYHYFWFWFPLFKRHIINNVWNISVSFVHFIIKLLYQVKLFASFWVI